MGGFVKGDIIVAALSFSDFSGGKRRPALVVAAPSGIQDVILCMITSSDQGDGHSIPVARADYTFGGLKNDPSYIRPCHLFSLDITLIQYKAGVLAQPKTREVIERIVELLRK